MMFSLFWGLALVAAVGIGVYTLFIAPPEKEAAWSTSLYRFQAWD